MIDDVVHRCRYEFAHVGSDALIQHGTDARFLVGVDEELDGIDCRCLPGRAFCCATRAPGRQSANLIYDLIEDPQVGEGSHSGSTQVVHSTTTTWLVTRSFCKQSNRTSTALREFCGTF